MGREGGRGREREVGGGETDRQTKRQTDRDRDAVRWITGRL